MFNKFTGIGRFYKNPELNTTTNEKHFVKANIVFNSSYDKKDNFWSEIYFWGKQAEAIYKYVRKGTLVYIEASIKTIKKNEKGVIKYNNIFTGEKIVFLTRSEETENEEIDETIEDAI